MGTKKQTAAPAAVLALGLLFAPLASIATAFAISIVAAAIGNLGSMSPAMAEPLTKKQSDALDAYNNSRTQFEQVLRQRRAQESEGKGCRGCGITAFSPHGDFPRLHRMRLIHRRRRTHGLAR